ncbi:uncharacterized protein LOC131040186 [Cryptomeria japonica]|uniref:uncharacterized protein LOC131040186 n=1 Tax=Cryptomeria japonica TaxID=3369 RepID=UPI0025AD1DE0|nr:uncharacterized protein LOC131040186 [Cryptomeria japonica]
MKKKLDTRFPASRIKKIMQADEDIGKIAQAVPLLVSKSLELFLQDLCDRTYEITLQRGAKTVSASHLKQCVYRYNVFDFLREIVNKVPDMGGSDAATGDEKNGSRRRKAQEGDENESDEEDVKRAKMGAHCGNTRGRGRRGRGRGSRGSTSARNDTVADKFEDEDLDLSPEHSDKQERLSESLTDVNAEARETKLTAGMSASPVVRNFDLNMELDESGDVADVQPAVKQEEMHPGGLCSVHPAVKEEQISSDVAGVQRDVKHEEPCPSWPHSDVDNVTLDSMHFHLRSDRIVDQDEDDYDNEDV